VVNGADVRGAVRGGVRGVAGGLACVAAVAGVVGALPAFRGYTAPAGAPVEESAA
jgi:hypothetical protein